MKVGEKSLNSLKHAISLYAYLLVVWGFYRLLFFQLPETVEILVIKPALWLIPTAFLIKRDKLCCKDIGFTLVNLFPTIYFTLSLGVLFALIGFGVNYLKYGDFHFFANLGPTPFFLSFVLSFITAFSEEIVFRGYIFTRFWQALKSEWLANLIVSFGWVIIHLPVAILDWKMSPLELTNYLLVVFIFSLGATFLYARTKNIFSPILLHVLWQWPIALFR
jgi:membrane protease YdiL (CAAX protease family)